jgi:hypothetical protein
MRVDELYRRFHRRWWWWWSPAGSLSLLSFCASRLRRCCVVVAALFVAEQNVRTVVVTSACLLSVSVSSACCRCGFATAAVSCLEECFCCCFCCSVSLPESFLFHAILFAAPEARCRIRLPLLSHISNNQHSPVWIIT